MITRRRTYRELSLNDIIMTVESNPEVLAICYAKGWAKHTNYMTKKEAEKVTSIGTAFRTSSISHFEELSYFTHVTSLADNAFRDCTSLAQIMIPSNITSIGARAFMGCKNMITAEIMGDITSIGASCFRNSTNFKNLIFHSLIPPTLGDSAIINSTNVRNGGIYVPDSSVDAYESILVSPYNTWVKPLSEYVE